MENAEPSGHPDSVSANAEQPVRILQVFRTLDRGGAETVVMEWLRHIDRERVIFDFVTVDEGRRFDYEDEIERLGGRIYKLPQFNIRNITRYVHAWIGILREHPEWRIVHGHDTVPAFFYFIVARVLHRQTIAHVHSANYLRSTKDTLRRGLRYSLKFTSHHLAACSRQAAVWTFGSKARYKLLPNSIDVKRYAHDRNRRSEVRADLGVGENFLIGHVGTFSEVKNHKRIAEVFAKARTLRKDTVLLLVGGGSLQAEIQSECEALGISASVIFAGKSSEIPGLLDAMDSFIFPSFHEGFPVALVEAQASGLPCVVSDTVTHEIAITPQVQFVSLSESDIVWANALLRSSATPRTEGSQRVREAGYDTPLGIQTLEAYYLDLHSLAVTR